MKTHYALDDNYPEEYSRLCGDINGEDRMTYEVKDVNCKKCLKKLADDRYVIVDTIFGPRRISKKSLEAMGRKPR